MNFVAICIFSSISINIFRHHACDACFHPCTSMQARGGFVITLIQLHTGGGRMRRLLRNSWSLFLSASFVPGPTKTGLTSSLSLFSSSCLSSSSSAAWQLADPHQKYRYAKRHDDSGEIKQYDGNFHKGLARNRSVVSYCCFTVDSMPKVFRRRDAEQ